MRCGVLSACLVLCAIAAVAAPNLAISADPYLTGGLFTNPLIPHEDEDVIITVRAICEGEVAASPTAAIRVANADDVTVAEARLDLERKEGIAEACWTWRSADNGLFMVSVDLDPDRTIAESDESDNTAELTLPVIVKGKGRDLHFPWYREVGVTRWATCVTSTGKGDHERLAERGVLPLNWEYGGMSWSYYDKEKAKTNPDEVLAEIEETFYDKFTSTAVPYGFGIDECGGYSGTWSLDASIASMKALVRARKETRHFYAVWNGGGLRPELAALYREGTDLLLLETYLWRALPDELGIEDVYETLVSRVEPLVRSSDMFQPAYGNHCYTLLALDTSERPDRVDLGEQEQVVRFIRRRFPEMRGIAWYTGGYGSYGLDRTDETDRRHEAVLRNADRLCLEYFIQPCITLMPESLWVRQSEQGDCSLVAAVSNIGSVDSGPVIIELLADGTAIATREAKRVPAGANRNENRVLLETPIALPPGPHTFQARILAASAASVLDGAITLERSLP
ncbi:MAG TPA: hypothetical protein PLO37_06945 [Candidatus Hydrogenedentes bacterium]|nr:hypothetical protein [Candidatus Hydrogenedentota bacterium]HPG66568.1 hypothetical protein [Candidatus Hydrogenedentota bacterium]